MSLHPILSMTHVSAGMLLALLAVLSVVLSAWIVVKTFTGHAEEAPMEQAKLVARFEHVIVGFVVLSGVIAIFTGSWSFSEQWLWMSLIIMAIYSGAMIFLTNPSNLVIVEGETAVRMGMQLIFRFLHILLLMIIFAYMFLKPSG